MATLSKRANGIFIIQFRDEHRQRKTITLGKRFTEKTAKELHNVVEKLVHCRDNATESDKRTAVWVETASVEIQSKLAEAGLIPKPQRHTLEELWDTFLAQKTGIKESTRKTYEAAQERFFVFFENDELLTSLTQARMLQWRDSLRGDFAQASVAGTIAKAKTVLNWAVTQEWITKSPLEGVGRGTFVNRDNDRFVLPEEYKLLLDASPCQDWRVIIALARIGGLRCPSEVLRLRWSDVNWEKDRFYVRSPKTEHHEGKGGRLVPLFPGLRVELERLFEMESSVGQEFVITRYRDPERTNLGTQFGRIVQLAGISPVPRPFDNMRASRSTEVYAEFGAYLESQWIGHSHKIAKDHYLQVREVDFDRAVAEDTGKFTNPLSECAAFSDSCAAPSQPRAAQCAAAGVCNSLQRPANKKTKSAVIP